MDRNYVPMQEVSRRRALCAVVSGRAHVLNPATFERHVNLEERLELIIFPHVQACSDSKLLLGRLERRVLRRDHFLCQYRGLPEEGHHGGSRSAALPGWLHHLAEPGRLLPDLQPGQGRTHPRAGWDGAEAPAQGTSGAPVRAIRATAEAGQRGLTSREFSGPLEARSGVNLELEAVAVLRPQGHPPHDLRFEDLNHMECHQLGDRSRTHGVGLQKDDV